MKRIAVIGIFALTVAIVPATRAQFTANFQTNIISGVTSNWSGSYIVGSNALADALLIQNSGVLSNGTGFIGYEIGANNNAAIISGTGSVWTSQIDQFSGDLSIGYGGAGNQMVVRGGGRVFNLIGYLGYSSSSSNNIVVVTGVTALVVSVAAQVAAITLC